MMNRKIRVLETIRQGQIGGGESHLLSLVENLDKTKFEPVVLSFTDGPMVERLKKMGVHTEVIYTEKPFDFTIWKYVTEFVAKNKVDLIHAHGTRAFSNIFRSADKLKIPVIYTIHGWSFHDDQNFLVKNFRLFGEKFLVGKSVTNISVSESNQATGKKYIHDFQSIIVNNGIDQKKFNPNNVYSDIRSELSIGSDDIVVMFLARFIHQKQPLRLIKTFAEAIKKNPKLKLVMVGDGDQKEEATNLVMSLNIEDKVIFLPFRQDVPDLLSIADIFVLPSLWEGLPIGLLEAMAMGKPIIATQVDGTSEVIQDNINGLLVKVEDVDIALPSKMIQLAENEAKRKELGLEAQKTITDRFSASNMTRQIEQIYFNSIKK